MGGFLGGLVTGLVVVVGAAAFLSLTSPMPQRPEVESASPEAKDVGAPAEETGMSPSGGDADLVELAPYAPEDQSEETDTLAALEGADTDPADKPKVEDQTEVPAKPQVKDSAGVAVEAEDAPLVPATPAEAPVTPQDEAQVDASIEQPSQPAAPTLDQSETALTLPEPADEGPQITTETETAPEQDTLTAAEAPDAEAAPTPDQTTVVAEAPPTPEAPETEDEAPQLAALPQIGEETPTTSGPSVGTPVVPLTERTQPQEAPAPDQKPIEVFATPFDNPEDKPLMTIVLIDDEKSLGGEALQDFPYPLSFAIDPTDPKANEKMARYRAMGAEVVVLADLPAAATAQDAEVSLSVWLDAIPESVALLEGTGSGIQGNRGLSDQVTAIADGTGRGLITQDNGLNTVQKLAKRNGVPSAVVFRDFDGAGQSPTVMRRFLDQAAFRARQEGAVIMLGRVRPDTISALLLWGLQDRATRVALAPVSAALLRDAGEE